MSHMALYRKWRPQIFEDVVEQDYVVKILKNTILSNRIAHAYLFSGTRGTGKTTMAKIFSRAVNCTNNKDGNPCNECDICKGILSGTLFDVMEIDAASNNSVDNVRNIRDEVVYSPAQAKYKVYIIDEVHMLSTGAFNALLKTLEEPPSHVIFILATTEPHKLPATILSRCQKFDFKKIKKDSIAKRLIEISKSYEIELEDDAALSISKLADGAMRDGISILDQCISTGLKKITYSDVNTIIGVADDNMVIELIDSIKSSNINKILEIVDNIVSYGKDISKFITDSITTFRNILVLKASDNYNSVIDLPSDKIEILQSKKDYWNNDEIYILIKEFSNLESSLKWSLHQQTLLESSLIRLSDKNFLKQNLQLEQRLTLLENMIEKIKSGSIQFKTSNIETNVSNVEKKKLK